MGSSFAGYHADNISLLQQCLHWLWQAVCHQSLPWQISASSDASTNLGPTNWLLSPSFRSGRLQPHSPQVQHAMPLISVDIDKPLLLYLSVDLFSMSACACQYMSPKYLCIACLLVQHSVDDQLLYLGGLFALEHAQRTPTQHEQV